ncbi:MAG: PQQ-dependent sugar dehydrogenase [Chthoniobacteraceae bacterium]
MRIALVLAAALLLPVFPARAELVNRWSFNAAAAAAPNGTVFNDSVSGLPMTVRGGGAALDGSRMVLPGTTTSANPNSTISAYLDLPNGIASSKTSITVEIWAAPITVQNWQPLFEFGRMNIAGDGAPGEWTGDAVGGPVNSQGSDLLGCSFNQAMNINSQYQVVMIDGGFQSAISSSLSTTLGTTYHYVITVQSNGAGTTTAWYRNGALVGTGSTAFALSAIEDVNNWLGRSQWSANSTTNAAYDEVRIYDHAFSAGEVSASFAAGADIQPPGGQADAATLHHGQKVRVNVLANDTGSITPATLAVVTPPGSGTAVVSGGQILYTHTTGSPAGDSFTYRVSGPLGTSADTTVNLAFSNTLRIPNSTLNVPATPPTTTYTTAPAFGALTFNANQAVNMATAPGDTQRLFVIERAGVIRMIPNVAAPSPTSSTFFNLAALCASRGESIGSSPDRGLMSMAFHPQHAANGRFFVWYSVRIGAGGPFFYRISRFNVQAGNPNAADTASEVVLIEQADPFGYHLGTDMHFGPDGYLYVSSGDGGEQFDSRRYGQRIDLDFHCALLRLDVDRLPANVEPNSHASVPLYAGVAAYKVPADNPFVRPNPTDNVVFNGQNLVASTVRSEFFSVGLRNPFRFSIDAPTGEIWVGDVGQLEREEINLATNGANFGWSWREGTIAGPNAGEALPGFTYTDPLYEYALGNGEFQGHSVTGGFVYRGTNLPDLTGAYIFGDYVDGHIWALRRTPAVTVVRLTGNGGQVAFRPDPSNGDVLMMDYAEGRIYRLVTGAGGGNYPATLSETGIFADVSDLSPAPGVLPITPNVSFWSDYAIKRRWFVIPDAVSTMTWSREGAWTFPDGMIWVKHFDLETTRGNPATAQRIETRLLVKNAAGVYGVSYRWNPAQTEATLVGDAGEEFDINIAGVGMQHYRIPSRSECISCHNPPAGHALSFNTRQLNRTENIHNFIGNQLTLLQNAGYFSNTPESPNLLPRHIRADETQFPVEARVRAYLDVNCANCHMAGGSTPPTWDARAPLTLAQTGLINGTATQSGVDPLNRLIVPGDTTHSIVLNRVAVTNGFSRMPPLGSNELDPGAIALLTEWINAALPAQQTYAQWRIANFGNDTSPEGDPEFDADFDGKKNRHEFLAGTAPLIPGSSFAPQLSLPGGNVWIDLNLPANRSFQVETSIDLQMWLPWNVPGNAGLPHPGGPASVTGPRIGDQQFFRTRIWEN